MQKFKLDIEKPCNEKWENFEQRGDSGFCSSCHKDVIDFTKFSDAEIRDYFKELPKNVCGRLRDDQMRVFGDPTPKRGLSRWMAWPIGATAILFSGYTASAQNSKHETVDVIPNRQKIKITFPRTISGTVRDENGTEIVGVEVLVEGLDQSKVLTDSLGMYEVVVPDRDAVLLFRSSEHVGTKLFPDFLSNGNVNLKKYDMSSLQGHLGGITSCGIRVVKPIDRTKELILRLFH